MAVTSQHPKDETFNFRVDPSLKAAFVAASEGEDKPAAQVLRELMRRYVAQKEREIFEVEARRQSLAIAARAGDPASDEAAVMREIAAEIDNNDFADEWTA
jgi:hypothetical protein